MIRLSGDDVRDVGRRVVQLDDPSAWVESGAPRRYCGRASLPGVSAALPVEVWYWPSARSYTQQPSLELHCVGAPPLVDALLGLLFAHGARPARAGEFTLRAFLSHRLDLIQAEAVLGVIDAADDVQLSAALAQLAGGLSQRIASLQETLLIDLADLEAGLDFVDENLEFIDRGELDGRLVAAQATVSDLLVQAERRLQPAVLHRVVLAGLPNAGKSTLFNALLGRAAAIVSAERGTTRDWLRAEVEWSGCSIELCDTAGQEDSLDGVGAAARVATEAQRGQASLVAWCSAADLSPAEAEVDAEARANCAAAVRALVHVITKCDVRCGRAASDALFVSAQTGAGLSEFRERIVRMLDARGPHVGELLGSTAARCRDSLRNVHAALHRAATLLAAAGGDELIAIELRAALEQTGQIAGQATTDDLLDRVFSRFCIGK